MYKAKSINKDSCADFFIHNCEFLANQAKLFSVYVILSTWCLSSPQGSSLERGGLNNNKL